MRSFVILFWDNFVNSFRNKKAVIFLVLYMMVFGFIAYVFFDFQREVEAQISQESISNLQISFMTQFGREVLNRVSDDAHVVNFLFNVPPINIMIFFISLIGTPLLIFILNYDRIAQEIYDGTIRYVLFRASRFQIFFAKFLSSLVECSLITLTALVLGILWGSIAFPQSINFSISILYGLRYWLIAQVFLAVFISFSLMASAVFKKPFSALIFCFVGYVLMPIIPFIIPYVSPYSRVYFNSLFFNSTELYFSLLMYIVYTTVFLSIGYSIFKRQDL